MQKAYDKVNLDFVIQVLNRFVFSYGWCKWIKAFIPGSCFLVLIIGSPSGRFSSTQEIWQGDLLSPFLFVLLVEGLSRSIKVENLRNLWKDIKISKVHLSFTHCLFVDDKHLMGEVNMEKVVMIKKVLTYYLVASRQDINNDKYKLVLFNVPSLVQ